MSKKDKEQIIYKDLAGFREREQKRQERWEKSTPEYKVLTEVLNNLSRAYYGLKYKDTKESILMEIVEARGAVKALMYLEQAKESKSKNTKETNDII